MLVLLLAIILVPVPALSASYAFSGTNESRYWDSENSMVKTFTISYNGAFTVDLNQPNGQFNGLSNTVAYPVTDWNFAFTSGWDQLPSHTFTSADSSAGYCTGSCVFAGNTQSTSLIIWSGNGPLPGHTGLQMRLFFLDGTLNQQMSWYGFWEAELARGGITSGTLTSVPEPDLFWPLSIGFVISMIASWSSDRLGQYRRSRPRLEMPRL